MSGKSGRTGSGKKAAVGTGAGIGGVLLLVGVVLVVRLLGGPDLSGLLTGDQPSQQTAQTETADRSGNDRAERTATAEPPRESTRERATRAEPTPAPVASPSTTVDDASEVAQLFREKRSDQIVTLPGRITRMLPDDNEGSRHQKFILTLSNGLTVLVSHNIDLAPRVPIDRGDRVIVHGEYEWTERGGVVHWTHHDPKGWREGGWIEYEGKRYE